MQISKLLSGLFERYFTDTAGDLDMTPLEEAFEKFANGELRDPNEGENPDYEPDSGFYFAFAEFALVAIEANIDQDVWSPLLNALVRTQEVFLSAYQPSPPRSKDRNLITKFHSAEDFTKDSQVDSQGMIVIRQRYHGLDEATLEQAAGWIAFRALKFGKIDNSALEDWKRRFGRCGP